eukprot:704889_1
MYRLPRGAIITVVSCDLDNTLWCIASLLRSASDAMYSAMERSEFGRAVAARFPRTEFTKLVACSNGITDLSKSSLGKLFDFAVDAQCAGAKKPDGKIFEKIFRLLSIFFRRFPKLKMK